MFAFLMNLIAGFLHSLNTLFTFTDHLKRWFLGPTWFLYRSITESSFTLFTKFFELVTCHSMMIRLNFALSTENLEAFITSHSVLTHIDSCFPRYWISMVVLLIEVYITLNYFHAITTFTIYDIQVF